MASIFTRLGKNRQGPGCDCLPAVSIRSQSLATELKSQPDDYGRHKNRVQAAGQPLEQPGGRPMRECRAIQRDERDRQQPCGCSEGCPGSPCRLCQKAPGEDQASECE